MSLVHGGTRDGLDASRLAVRMLRGWARAAFAGLLVGAAVAGVTHAFEPGVLPLVGAAFGGGVGLARGAAPDDPEGADGP